MWKADIFAFQKTKFRKREVGIKFPRYYDYWSFYENCPTSHQQSDNSQGVLLAHFAVIRHTCLAKRSVPVALQLAKKPIECLEYVVIHELVHLIEKNHTNRFRALVEEYCPTWKEAKKILETMPLDYMEKEN